MRRTLAWGAAQVAQVASMLRQQEQLRAPRAQLAGLLRPVPQPAPHALLASTTTTRGARGAQAASPASTSRGVGRLRAAAVPVASTPLTQGKRAAVRALLGTTALQGQQPTLALRVPRARFLRQVLAPVRVAQLESTRVRRPFAPAARAASITLVREFRVALLARRVIIAQQGRRLPLPATQAATLLLRRARV